MENNKNSHLTDDAPPFLGSWRAIYILVIGVLIFFIVLFTLISIYLQ